MKLRFLTLNYVSIKSMLLPTFAALSHWTVKKVHAMLRRYTPAGKRTTYHKYFYPIAQCSNLKRWQNYTNWLTPSVQITEEIRIGLLPMAIISTAKYWKYRGRKIPHPYPLSTNQPTEPSRETNFYTDNEAIETTMLGQASRFNKGKYSQAYFHNRKLVLQRDKHTCTVCGYKSKRQKGEVHDLEIHHIDPTGDYRLTNLQTVCLTCHYQLTANRQAD